MAKSKIKKELKGICEAFGETAGGYESTWEEVEALVVVHSSGALSRDFTEWMEKNQGDDFPGGAVPCYLKVARERLGRPLTASTAVLDDPRVSNLVRELSHRSKGSLIFTDKHRIRLADTAGEFTDEEILTSYTAWLSDQNLEDLKNLQFLPAKFVQASDQLCYSLRKRREETAKTKILRDQTATRLQEEAEQERLAKAQQEKLEEGFDLDFS